MTVKKYGRLKPVASKLLGRNQIEMTLTEGKNHQIRIMLAELGLTVESLRRVAIMNIRLGRLGPGQTRVLSPTEITTMLKNLKR